MIDFTRVFNNLITVGILAGIVYWVYTSWKQPSFNPNTEKLKNLFRRKQQ